jgi:hypothetical protein
MEQEHEWRGFNLRWLLFCCKNIRPVAYDISAENDRPTDADFHVRRDQWASNLREGAMTQNIGLHQYVTGYAMFDQKLCKEVIRLLSLYYVTILYQLHCLTLAHYI